MADTIALGRARGVDFLVAVHYDGRTRIFEALTGKRIPDVSELAFRSLGVTTGHLLGQDVVVLGGTDGVARIVEPTTGRVVRQLTGHTAEVHTVAIGQADGRALVVTGSTDATVRLFDPATGTSTAIDVVDIVNQVTASAGGSIFIASGCSIINIGPKLSG
ncbi:WD40 repeat domain-containing protein [Phytohabitans sp. LJ34]|uniref:WD40 repeat domain-containing protein n=1 Tax=Phytohabitans sp. LJ34 TaxID=3452217 RepID=UPI003F896028